jgi:hypothetical protein
MKIKYNVLIAAVLLAFFLAGCGCGEDNAELVSIEVTPFISSIEQGATQQFIATGTFSDNTTRDITTEVNWSSTANNIAQISNAAGSQGLATSAGVGTTTITATTGSIFGTATLTVVPRLVSITVSPADQTITLGATQQFAATGHYSDSTTQDITTAVTWGSSASEVAAISNAAGTRGLATAAAVGTTTITATSGVLHGSTSLTVVLPLVSIKVTPENAFVMFGRTVQFTAIGTYADGSTQDITLIVIWSSSDISIATISNEAGSKGMATTDHKLGMTIITATLGAISGSANLYDP